MASPQESVSMALFCDFENVALGVRDAKFEKFDIKPVLERLLLKGSIVVKKAYCDCVDHIKSVTLATIILSTRRGNQRPYCEI
jgi:hypothetical protein